MREDDPLQPIERPEPAKLPEPEAPWPTAAPVAALPGVESPKFADASAGGDGMNRFVQLAEEAMEHLRRLEPIEAHLKEIAEKLDTTARFGE